MGNPGRGRAGAYYSLMEQAVLTVRVTPRAGRDEISGWRDGELLVRLRAPPVEGQANEALRRLLSKRLSLPLSSIEIIGGATSRTKRVRLLGLRRPLSWSFSSNRLIAIC